MRTNNMPEAPVLPRVLIVDDHPLIRKACRQALSGVAEVATATDGEDALDQLACAAFDAVVLDLQMPTLDGVATYDAICERFPSMSARVVMMTGGMSVQEEAELHARQVPWALKPVCLADLERLVALACANGDAAGA